MNELPHPPKLIADPQEMFATVRELQSQGARVGLVPTMGALHAGHLSLVEAARRHCDRVVVTIFVNPTQFAPHEDFNKYPRTLAADLELLAAAQTDFVFAPTSEAIYPPGHSTAVDPPAVAAPLEGRCRPGHFRGVATIVLKLFHLVPANAAFFGQKDFQQALVLRRMALDLNVPIAMHVCPTVREPDGLALSSRNRYLLPAQRQQALSVSQALREADRLYQSGERNAEVVGAAMRRLLTDAGITRIDYAALCDPETLIERGTLTAPTVALIAAFVGTTRLIDNHTLGTAW